MAEFIVASTIQAIERTKLRTLDEIETTRLELQLVQALLKDAYERQDKDESSWLWESDIKILFYGIEDALETYAVNVESTKREGLGKILRVLANIQELFAMSKAVRKIRAFRHRLIEQRRNLLNNIREERSSSVNDCDQWLKKIAVHMPTNDFVGFESDTAFLVSYMVDEENSYRVISICGMGGTGKTALARRICNHAHVKQHFEYDARVYVGQTFQRRKILEDILTQLVPGANKNKMVTMEEEDLVEELHHILRKKRCLVFLDDIWHLDLCESLRIALLFDKTGSKLLLTTRMRGVAEVASREGYIHTMRPLSEDDSWELFKIKAFSRASPGLQDQAMMDDMGRKIASRCQGLPLAIDVLGSFMETRRTFCEWEMLYRNTDPYLFAEGISEIPYKVLVSSFHDLPYLLKPCFLYLGYFPEGSKIETEKLFLLWMAEGILELEDSGMNETMMEIADRYLRELEQRILVEVQEEEVPTVRSSQSCSLHWLMRQFCLKKGKEDEFLKVIDFRGGSQLASGSLASDCPLRRLVIYLDKYKSGCKFPLILRSAGSLKSLLIYGNKDEPGAVLPQEISELSKFKRLKSLDFYGLDFQKVKLPRGISALIRLRYLSFNGCALEALPSEIGRLSYLLGLDLRIRPWCKMTIPNVLRKLERLKHLYLPETFKTSKGRILRLNGLTKLETLKQFNSNMCHAKDLSEMINLRYLTASTDGRIEDLEWIIGRMNMTTEHILRSSLDVRNFDCHTEERHSTFRKLLGSRVLQSISVEGHLGQLPPYHEISQSLMEIVFSGSQLQEDPLLVFEKLPNLRVLVLNDDAFLGAAMVCSARGFPELRRLELSNLHHLEKLSIENGALGKLTTLAIENCSRLERLPHGVKFVSNLKNLRIRKMPQSFEKRLRLIPGSVGEDVDNIQHVSSISFVK